MTVYQQLQLNQAGSKALVRSARTRPEKAKRLAVYILKVLLTAVFCCTFVIAFSLLLGSGNSIVGVVVLLMLLAFRQVDLGIRTTHGVGAMWLIFAVLAFGPRLANISGPVLGFFINAACILLLLVLGCHNPILSNQSTLVLNYLLLYGYDAADTRAYLLRLAGLLCGAVLISIVLLVKGKGRGNRRTLADLFLEFDLNSSRTRWYLKMALGICSIMLFVELLGFDRAMWAGIAAMSVCQVFRSDMTQRVKFRAPGNVVGAVLFVALYAVLPAGIREQAGILGGICVGFSASYGFQTIFNSLGALVLATGSFGVATAVFLRIFNNAVGSLYMFAFDKVLRLLGRALEKRRAKPACGC